MQAANAHMLTTNWNQQMIVENAPAWLAPASVAKSPPMATRQC
jgi:hypothetical protein